MTTLEAKDGLQGNVPVPDSAESRPASPEELVDRYQRRIYAVIYRMTGRHADTDDLCQETFLQIFRSYSRFEPGTNLDSWVYRIAMNVSVDFLRRRGKEKAKEEDLRRAGPRTGETPALDAETEKAVRAAIDELPPQQKAVVILRMFENLSHEKIAQVVEAPVATVRWRLFSAIEKLESLLGRLVEPAGE
jgi:RNA polymerase sigma-70 factor (ECF subfamily)